MRQIARLCGFLAVGVMHSALAQTADVLPAHAPPTIAAPATADVPGIADPGTTARPARRREAANAPPSAGPEGATGYRERSAVAARRFMVATANPHASAAAEAILRRGGSAVDAAIAATLVLNLVEPQSSGIGGGAFLLHWDARQKRVAAWDGRETAPAAADDSLFLDANGQPLGFLDAVVGGRAVGVPGLLRLFEAVHRRHGKLPWASLFTPAIRLARQGHPLGERLHRLLSQETALLQDPAARALYYDAAGRPHPVGHPLRNLALAATLSQIARHGPRALYDGQIGRAIVERVRSHATNPGRLTMADLRTYRARERIPVCAPYRAWVVCGMPPPSSGGIAVAQILGILRHTAIATQPPRGNVPGATAVHLFAEAGRLAFADRGLYIADPDFVSIPAGLLDADYLTARARLIGPDSLGTAQPGTPRGVTLALAPDQSADVTGTTHLAIVDAAGNGVSLTASIEDGFGTRLMVGGFLLNNQLTDFSFVAREHDRLVANRVEPGKRPRSSMAPTLVFDPDHTGQPQRLVLAIGSAGGPAIINHVAKALVAHLDWGLDIQAAISLPQFGSRNGPTEIERGRLTPDVEALLAADLRARGHTMRLVSQPSGMQGVQRTIDGWLGGVDPRREGLARGR